MTKFALGIIILSFFGQLLYTKNIVQKNPESLFLTDSGKSSLLEYKEKYPSRSKIIAYLDESPSLKSYDKITMVNEYIIKLCEDHCSTLLPEQLYKSKEEFQGTFDSFEFKDRSLVSRTSIGFIIFMNNDNKLIENSILKYLENDFKLVGHSYINRLLDESSKLVQDKIFPLVFVLSFLFLIFITKSFRNAFFLFFSPLYSSVFSLSVIKLFFQSMNMVSSVVPLICFIISLSISLHLYFTATNEKSFLKSFDSKRRPIALMIVTTFIGFLSLFISQIGVIREFGILCSFLILITSMFSLYWLRLINNFFDFTNEHKPSMINVFPQRTFSLPSIVILLLVSLIGGYFGAKNIKVVTDASNYFSNRPEVRGAIVHSKVLTGGIPLVEILIKKKDQSFEFIQGISKVELKIVKELDVNIHSQLSSIRNINKTYSGNDSISSNKFSFNLLRSRIPQVLKEEIDENYYKITILGTPVDVNEFLYLISKLRVEFSGYDISFNGLFYNLMKSQKEMISTLFFSFLTSLLLMSFLVLLVFKRAHIFFTFLISNIAPVGISLMILPFIGLSLNIATVMTYSIGLGIVVDSSFHIFHSLEKKEGNFQSYFLYTLRPIICSSLLLFFCFSLFAIYDFLPIHEFGLNLALIVFLGFIFDVFVLPTLFLKSSSLFGGRNENL